MGQIAELASRLQTRNAGKVRSTKAYRPWVMLHHEALPTRSEAMKREAWYKSSSGRKAITRLVNDFPHNGLSVPLSAGRDLDPAIRDRAKPSYGLKPLPRVLRLGKARRDHVPKYTERRIPPSPQKHESSSIRSFFVSTQENLRGSDRRTRH